MTDDRSAAARFIADLEEELPVFRWLFALTYATMNADRFAVERLVADVEYDLKLSRWLAMRLDDCGELVYRHGVIECHCGRTIFQAYARWKRQGAKP